MKLVILGAPGSGKGTQAKLLANHLNLKHLSTGDLLRAEVSKKTKLGRLISNYIDEGKFVTDDLIEKILVANLPEDNFILDGFPRNINQCEILKKLTKIDAVVELIADQEEIVKRITGRRLHEKSGRTYHTEYNPPKIPNIDDISGEKLVIRKDDSKETVVKRLNTYNDLTKPVVKFFSSNHHLIKIDATKSIKDIEKNIIESLNLIKSF